MKDGIVAKIIIVLFLLSFIPIHFTEQADAMLPIGQEWTTLYPNYDGYIRYTPITHAYVMDNSSNTVQSRIGPGYGYYDHGFVEWNISSLAGETVEEVTINWTSASVSGGGYVFCVNCEMQPNSTNLNTKPLLRNLYDNLSSSSLLLHRGECINDFPGPVGTSGQANTTYESGGYDNEVDNGWYNLLGDDPKDSLQAAIDSGKGWFALGLYQGTGNSWGYFDSVEAASLGIKLEVKVLQPSDVTVVPNPANHTSGGVTTPTLNVTVTNNLSTYYNMTWYWFVDGAWTLFASDYNAINGTYGHVASNFTASNEVYYWGVEITDYLGRASFRTFDLRVGGVSRPTNAKCVSVEGINQVNISWTENADGGGQTYTIVRIGPDGEPPDTITDGALVYNGTANYTTVTVGDCNSFSLWTNWRNASGGPATINDSFLHLKVLTINHNYISETLAGFPVYVHTTDTDLAARAQDDGDDIAFYSYGGAKLPHEIEYWNSTSGELGAWVNVSKVHAASNTTFYMLYGNATCSSQQDKSGVWDNHFVSVYHMNESGRVWDSTGNWPSTSTTNTPMQNYTNAVFPNATWFDTDERYDFSQDACNVTDNNFTIALWINLSLDSGDRYYMSKQEGGGNFDGFQFMHDAGSNNWRASFDPGVAAVINLDLTDQMAENLVWHYHVIKRDPTYFYQTINDFQHESHIAHSNIKVWGAQGLQLCGDRGVGGNWLGYLDEIQISDILRNDSWINASYYNQNKSDFLSIGDELNITYHWTLSPLHATLTSCCSGGGTYYFAFRYENTTSAGHNNLIDLSQFPCSQHKLNIYFEDKSNESLIIDSTSSNPINYFYEDEPLYFELTWNYSVNVSCSGFETTASYKRVLTPHAAENLSGQNTITFYLFVDKKVYADYYTYTVDGGNATYGLPYNYRNTLIKYTYDFEDKTHNFDAVGALDTYSTIYCYNMTKKMIIHEQYWDSADQVYPYLLYEKSYYIGCNSSLDDMGLVDLAPTGTDITPTILINVLSADVLDFPDFFGWKYGWSSGDTGLWFFYQDKSYSTESVTLTIYDVDGVAVYTDTLTDVDSNNWSWPLAQHNRTYFFHLDISNPNLPDSYLSSPTGILIAGQPFGISASYINKMMITILGKSPFYNPDPYSPSYGESLSWTNVFLMFGMMFIFAGLVRFTPAFAMIAAGAAGIFGYIFISGIAVAFIVASIMSLVIGIMYILIGRGDRS